MTPLKAIRTRCIDCCGGELAKGRWVAAMTRMTFAFRAALERLAAAGRLHQAAPWVQELMAKMSRSQP